MEDKKITKEKIINGLKYICEHRNVSQEELQEGLIALGCDFSLEDIEKEFPSDDENNFYAGVRHGNLKYGASIVANTRNSEMGREFCESRFLSADDPDSIYEFIRKHTGDPNYTKNRIDTLYNQGGRRK